MEKDALPDGHGLVPGCGSVREFLYQEILLAVNETKTTLLFLTGLGCNCPSKSEKGSYWFGFIN